MALLYGPGQRVVHWNAAFVAEFGGGLLVSPPARRRDAPKPHQMLNSLAYATDTAVVRTIAAGDAAFVVAMRIGGHLADDPLTNSTSDAA